MKLNPLVIGAAVAGAYWLLSSRKASAATLAPAAPVTPVTPAKPVVATVKNVQTSTTPLSTKSPTAAWGGSGYQPQNKSGILTTIQVAPPTYDAYGNVVAPAQFADYDSAGNQVGATYAKSDAQASGIRRASKRFGK